MDMIDFVEARVQEDKDLKRESRSVVIARKRILEHHRTASDEHRPQWRRAVQLLATAYADHPDYRKEWTP